VMAGEGDRVLSEGIRAVRSDAGLRRLRLGVIFAAVATALLAPALLLDLSVPGYSMLGGRLEAAAGFFAGVAAVALVWPAAALIGLKRRRRWAAALSVTRAVLAALLLLGLLLLAPTIIFAFTFAPSWLLLLLAELAFLSGGFKAALAADLPR
jgi:hypothetical protein